MMKKKKSKKSDRALLGEEARRLRKKQGLNQSQVAKAMGRSVATVSKIESGDHPIDIDTIGLLATALKTSGPRLVWSIQKPKLESDPAMKSLIPVFDQLLESLDGHKA